MRCCLWNSLKYVHELVHVSGYKTATLLKTGFSQVFSRHLFVFIIWNFHNISFALFYCYFVNIFQISKHCIFYRNHFIGFYLKMIRIKTLRLMLKLRSRYTCNSCFNSNYLELITNYKHVPLFYNSLLIPRRFYLTWDTANLYQGYSLFIQGSLEWQFSELFSANLSLWNQFEYIAFNIFSCRILINLYKMLMVLRISNEKTNYLTWYGVLCRNVTTFYWQKLPSEFQVQEKLKACRISKLNFLRKISLKVTAL